MEGSGRRFCVEPDTPYDPPCDQPQAYRGSSPSQAPNRAVASSYDGKEQGTSQQIEDIKERLLSCRWKPWRNRDPNCAFLKKGEQTTPVSQQPSQFVTITHPFHPLRGRRLELLHIERGYDPDLLLRRPDGTLARIAMSATNFAAKVDQEGLLTPPPLLDPGGLRQARLLVDAILQRRSEG